MFKLKFTGSLLVCCGIFFTHTLHAHNFFNAAIEFIFPPTPVTIVPTPPPARFDDGFGDATEEFLANQRISMTKQEALLAWVGGKKRICQECYDSNLELKKRVELTALHALHYQSMGYDIEDAVETAKTFVMANMGGCPIPDCRNGRSRR